MIPLLIANRVLARLALLFVGSAAFAADPNYVVSTVLTGPLGSVPYTTTVAASGSTHRSSNVVERPYVDEAGKMQTVAVGVSIELQLTQAADATLRVRYRFSCVQLAEPARKAPGRPETRELVVSAEVTLSPLGESVKLVPPALAVRAEGFPSDGASLDLRVLPSNSR